MRYLQGLALVATAGRRTQDIAAKGWHTSDTPRQYVQVTLIGVEDLTITPAGISVLAQEIARQSYPIVLHRRL